MHLRTVDREHLNPRQPGIGAQREHLAEHGAKRALMTLSESRRSPCDGTRVGRHDPERDTSMHAPLNAP